MQNITVISPGDEFECHFVIISVPPSKLEKLKSAYDRYLVMIPDRKLDNYFWHPRPRPLNKAPIDASAMDEP